MLYNNDTPDNKGIAEMEPAILLVADYAAIDASGKLTVVGVFNKIFARKFPAKHPLLYVTIRFVAELGETERERTLEVFLVDQDYNKIWNSPALKFRMERPASGEVAEFTPIVALQQLEFQKPGKYVFKVRVDNDIVGSIPFDVVPAPSSQPSE
jgi:hypothetical protein